MVHIVQRMSGETSLSGEIRKGKGKKEEKGGRRRDGESSGQRSCQCDDEG